MVGGSHLSNCSIELGYYWRWYFELLPWKLKEVSPASDEDLTNRLRRIDQELNSRRYNSTLISCTIFIHLPCCWQNKLLWPYSCLATHKNGNVTWMLSSHSPSVEHSSSFQFSGNWLSLKNNTGYYIQSGSSFLAENCQFSCYGAPLVNKGK